MDIETFTLPNGLRFVHKRVRAASACCGITINAGTRDELPNEHGMAHFLEHVLFKGTKRRTSMHINSFLEARGGDLNAYTTKEETAVYAIALRADLERMFDIIADIVFGSTFPPDELEKEKDVVRDEINLYRDTPAELIFDDFEARLFPASSLGRSILGTSRSLGTFSQAGVQQFVRRCYTTRNMVFATVGSASAERIATLAERYFAPIPAEAMPPERTPAPPYVPFQATCKRHVHQAHCLLGSRTFGFNHSGRYAIALLANMLGGPSQNSLLNLALRERHALAYSVEVASTLYSDCGAATIYFGTDKGDLARCLAIVDQELDALRSHNLKPAKLAAAKRQLLGQLAIASDSNEHTMLSIGKNLLNYGRVDPPREVAERVRAISADQVREMCANVFAPNALSQLIYT